MPGQRYGWGTPGREGAWIKSERCKISQKILKCPFFTLMKHISAGEGQKRLEGMCCINMTHVLGSHS